MQENDDDSQTDAKGMRIVDAYRQISELCRKGYSFCGGQSNRCYLNIGRSGFANFSPTSGLDFFDDSRSIATTDWDHDGDVDVVISSRNGPQLRILTNQLNSQNDYIHFSLVGTSSNRDAIGARVEVFLDNRKLPLVKTISAGSGCLAQSSKRLHFGLGKGARILNVNIIWPNGTKQSFPNLDPNTDYKIVEGQNEAVEFIDGRAPLVSIKNLPAPVTIDSWFLERAVFYPPVDLPILEFRGAKKKYFAIETFDNRPLLVLFWTDDLNSKVLLQEFSDLAAVVATKNVDVLGVYIDQASRPENEDWHVANRLIEQTTFPFRWGTAALSTISKLKKLAEDWFFTNNMGQLPFALLVDSQQQIRVFYSARAISAAQVIADLPLCSRPIRETRDQAAARKGTWIARDRAHGYRRLISVFKKMGFDKDAKYLSENSTAKTAAEFMQLGQELHSRFGTIGPSRDFFEQAIKTDSEWIPAYVGYGQFLIDASRLEKSPEAKQQLLKEAADNFANAVERDPLNTEATLGRATATHEMGKTNVALQRLKDYLEINPHSYEVHAMIGQLSYLQKDYRQAKVYLAEAAENRPSLPNVANELGVLYLHSDQYEQALHFLQLANRLQPSDVHIIRSLAEAEFQNQNFERAMELTRLAIEKNPTDVRSKKILAWLYATCPDKSLRDGKQGIRLARNLFDLYGESAIVLEIFAACLAENSDFEVALKFQERALEKVNIENSHETYSTEQRTGLNTRLNLYRQKRPYRTTDMKQIPVAPPRLS